MRLDKMLSHMGFGSRKDVKQLIKSKKVRINGDIANKPNMHIDVSNDEVSVHGELVKYREFIYLMLHKPQGVISATEDGYDQTVIDLLEMEDALFEPFPVGRLDKDTEGLLLITNDGKLAHALTSPRRAIEKTYVATIDGAVTEEHVQQFSEGVTLDDGYETKPGKLRIITSGETSEIELVITEGKFHQVKRMFQAIGREVTYLKRVQMGEIQLDDRLQLGSYRELTEEELAYCLALR